MAKPLKEISLSILDLVTFYPRRWVDRTSEARVRQWMTVNPVTIAPETPIDEAAQIMFDNNFRHLPVVKDGRPLGIVSLRLLARWAFDKSVQTAE